MKTKMNKMASPNAIATAQDVSEAVRKGGQVVLGKIIKKRYSLSTSKSPQRVTQTKSYQSVMKPIIEQLEEERQRAITMLRKKISKAQYHHLVEALDKMTKNIQLLSGKETENIKGSIIYLPK